MKILSRIMLNDDERQVIGRAVELRVHLPDDVIASLTETLDALDLNGERRGPGMFATEARDLAASEGAKISHEAGFTTATLCEARHLLVKIREHYAAIEREPGKHGAPGPGWDATRRSDAQANLERYVRPALQIVFRAITALNA